MDLFNYGYIDMPGVTKEDAAKVLNRFGLKPSLGNDYDMEIKDTPGGCKAVYDGWYSNDLIEDILNKFAEDLYEKGISVSGLIDFYGEDKGRYEISPGYAKLISYEECVIMDMTDLELISEAERRGFEIAKAEGSKEL